MRFLLYIGHHELNYGYVRDFGHLSLLMSDCRPGETLAFGSQTDDYVLTMTRDF